MPLGKGLRLFHLHAAAAGCDCELAGLTAAARYAQVFEAVCNLLVQSLVHGSALLEVAIVEGRRCAANQHQGEKPFAMPVVERSAGPLCRNALQERSAGMG